MAPAPAAPLLPYAPLPLLPGASDSGFIQEVEFREVYAQLFKEAGEEEVVAAFQRLDTQHNGRVDYVSWTQRVRLKHTPYIAQRIHDSGGEAHTTACCLLHAICM